MRVSKHKYPMPEDGEVCGELRQVAANCGELRPESNPIQSESNPNPNPNPTREPRNANTKNFDFDVFWNEYPRKESKPAAQKAFEKLNPDEQLMQKIIVSIKKWKQSSQWQDDDGRYIPYPASWLNQRKWEDEPPTAMGKKVQAQEYEQRDYSAIQADIERQQAERVIARLRAEGRTDV